MDSKWGSHLNEYGAAQKWANARHFFHSACKIDCISWGIDVQNCPLKVGLLRCLFGVKQVVGDAVRLVVEKIARIRREHFVKGKTQGIASRLEGVAEHSPEGKGRSLTWAA